jgi:2-polyprenyl-6-hydroxyphenyl methylase/3-demethylubiquinone-9 3-methyltransferase
MPHRDLIKAAYHRCDARSTASFRSPAAPIATRQNEYRTDNSRECVMKSRRPTVDEADVERFERLGEDWWNPRGSMRMLHRLNPLRVAWIANIARDAGLGSKDDGANPLAGLSIVDIGCGGGILSEALARLGARVTAIDPAPGSIDVARNHAGAAGLAIDYRAATAEDLAAAGEVFDIVCSMEVLEHVTDMRAFLKTAGALARPDGLLFAATLNRTAKSFALAILGAEYVLRWVPKGTHQWEKFITPVELEAAMEEAGLEAFARTGVVYDPLRAQWRESHDMAINYMMAARRPAH